MTGATLPPAEERVAPTILAPTQLEYTFLRRLATLIRRQDSARDARQRTALARAAFSTYLDCVDLGVGDEAERLLTRDPLALLLWRQGRQH